MIDSLVVTRRIVRKGSWEKQSIVNTKTWFRAVSFVLLTFQLTVSAGVIPNVAVASVSSQGAANGATNLLNGVGLFGDIHTTTPNGSTWLTSVTTANAFTNAFVTFDLGSLHTINKMKVWNYNEPGATTIPGRGLQRANVSYSSDNVTFTTNLVNQVFDKAPLVFTNFGQTIDMGGISAQYIRINVLTNYGANGTDNRVGLSKVQFIDYTVVPTIKLATRSYSGDRITVQFSESVQALSANNIANYTVQSGTNIVTISSATLSQYNDTVRLQVPTLDSNLVYTVAVQNIRDVSDTVTFNNAPVTVEAEFTLWLMADQGVTADVNNAVSQWNDQSGANNHAVQVTNVSQPILTAGAVNGKPAIHFDGVTNLLEVPGSSSLQANRDVSVFLVVSTENIAPAGNQSPISKGPLNVPATYDLQIVKTTGKISFVRGNGSGFNSFPSTAGIVANQFYLLSVVVNGTNGSSYVNGNFNGSGPILTGLADRGNPIRLGIRQDNATKFVGNMAEAMVIRGAVSDAEKSTIENYLGAKYGISVVALGILAQPEDATRMVGQTATFSVTAQAGTPTIFYQWQKGTNNIVGATNSIYTTPTLALTNNASTYRVVVSTPLGISTNSAFATLTVNADTQAPIVSSALKAAGNVTNVIVNFSEPVTAGTATTLTNYTLNQGATISAATVGSVSSQVILTTSILDTNTVYLLSVKNIQDLAANTMVPQTISILPSSMSIWLRADSGVSTNASGLVNQWDDQSGNTNHAQQYGLTMLRPTWTSVSMNGKPVLSFDGASNYLQAVSTPSLAITGDLSIVVVAKMTDLPTGAVRQLISKTTANLPAPFDYYINNGANGMPLYRGNGTVNARVLASALPSAGVPHIMTAVMAGTNVSHFLDGLANGTGNLSTTIADAGRPLKIGSRDALDQFMKGDIAEVLVFSSAISTVERKALASYLGFKYFPFSITTQPQSVAKLEGETATFTVAAAAGPATFNYQWQKNLSNIPGATSLTYTTPALTTGDNNAGYRAVIFLPDGTTTNSDSATLTVTGDSVPPTVVSARLKLWNQTQLVVTFSEAVDPSFATNIANYTLDNGAVVTAAVMGDAPNQVILTVSGLNPPTSYSLTVQNVKDLFGNAIVSSPTALGVYPASLALWLKADAGVTADGQNLVTQWTDQSGHANHAATLSGNPAPLFTTNGFSGLPVVNFDGTTQYLFAGNDPSLQITGDMTIYTVVRIKDFTSTANEIGLVGKSGGAAWNQPGPYDYYLNKTTGLPKFYRGNGLVNGSVIGLSAPGTNSLHALSVVMSGTSVTHYLDGATNGTGTIVTTIADSGYPLGIGTRYDLRPKMNGDMAEILIFSAALSDQERQLLDSYVANKYAILASPISLSVQTTGTNIDLAWPVTPLTLALETTLSLSPTNWVAVTNSITTAAGTNKFTINSAAGSRFYRLHKP
ncbi:MAG: Coagulation factor 5/8 type domain protein [Verrucomicrobiales bacterium]|nr:Coagulation factor 5/8 type domain protein [Verrucomicrobiales bacterium]